MIDREILVAVTGGIASYKSAALVSRLVQAGAQVTVVMTQAAEAFVGAATFAALTNRPVARHAFDDQNYPLGPHIELARQAEVLCVAPATANFMAKAAHGIADDLVSTTYLAFTGHIVVAPAMNTQMWNHVAVQRNVAQLKKDGVQFIDPEEGWLSCRDKGGGRMAEPEAIFSTLSALE